jgi:hypothetical protein
MRTALNDTATYPVKLLTSGLRRLAGNKALDPKYLTQEAYNAGKLGGSIGAYGTDLALLSKASPTAVKSLMGTLTGLSFADAVGTGAVHTGDAIIDAVQEARAAAKQQAVHDASINLFDKRHKPVGPVVSVNPDADSKMPTWDLAAMEEIKKDPVVKEQIRQQRIRDYKDVIEHDKAVKRLSQAAKQITGAGAGGLIGLTAAHQITKRIPALKKRRVLRYLLNAAAAGGLGYAGWKLTQKV